MINRLGLKGNDLIVYAVIYTFSQKDGQYYNGSLQYLADWTNSTKRGLLKNLKSLMDRNLIEKKEITLNGVKHCEYRAIAFPGLQQSLSDGYGTKFTSMEQSSPGYGTEFAGVWNKVHGGIELSSPNNKEYIKEDNKDIYKGTYTRTRARVEMPPSLDEVKAYCKERGNVIDAEYFYDFYQARDWMTGKNKMKDWKAAVRYWERDEKKRKAPNASTPKVYVERKDFLGK